MLAGEPGIGKTRLLTELARRLTGANALVLRGGALGRQLYTQSEGNPFFTEELLRQWLEEGWLSRATGYWELVDQGKASLALPGSIASLIGQHLARLPDKVTAVSQIATVIGRNFEISFLANVVGEEPEAVEERLVAAEKAGLIRGSGQGWYNFSHDKIREGIYAQVTPLRRRRLHGFIGRELEQQTGSKSAQTCENLAYHFSRSGDRERGALYAWLAGERALAAWALAEAQAHYQTALELLEPTDARLGEWLLKAGEVEHLNGKEHAALTTFQKAQDYFKAVGDKLGEGRTFYELGRTYWRLEELKPARLPKLTPFRTLPTALSSILKSPVPPEFGWKGWAMRR